MVFYLHDDLKVGNGRDSRILHADSGRAVPNPV